MCFGFFFFFFFFPKTIDEGRNNCRPSFTITEFAVCLRRALRFFDCQSNQYQPWQNYISRSLPQTFCVLRISHGNMWLKCSTCFGAWSHQLLKVFIGNISMDSGGSSSVTRTLSYALSAPRMDYWRQSIIVQQSNKEMPPMCNLLFCVFFSPPCLADVRVRGQSHLMLLPSFQCVLLQIHRPRNQHFCSEYPFVGCWI